MISKIKRAVRGEVKLTTAALEALRRSRVSWQERRERGRIDQSEPLIFADPFARMNADQRLAWFRGEREVRLFDGLFATSADAPEVGKEFQWRRDPLSGYVWPLDYHRDIQLIRGDGSDVRVLWELNRMGHLLPLAAAYDSTRDERYSTEFFGQVKSWQDDNPYGRGPNWTCAMEVALRAMNLLAAFEIFRRSPQLNSDRLQSFLQLLQQHGTYIRRNLEFSYIATSNHYLSDVVGLLWLGVLLPELRDAAEWRAFGLDQTLREMDKQVLPDGADFEASTGYHRFVTELFLYSFMLCRTNNIEIKQHYWSTLEKMLLYIRAYTRPDGFAPLIGDTDGGQVVPVTRRRANDHAYLLPISENLFDDPVSRSVSSAFPHAGTYIMRHDDLYLCFNASGAGINGRGSHGHNDALSIEVSAGGRALIVDPGTYVYSADLHERHKFRSTAYHSTVQIDGAEQNTIDVNTPFVIGNEARPRVLQWQSSEDFDKVVGEHYGYAVTHRRTITFNKRERAWLIDDEFFGDGEHVYETRFHFAPGLDVSVHGASVKANGLVVKALRTEVEPVLEPQPVSREYGEKQDAVSACWRISGRPGKLSWEIKIAADNTDESGVKSA